MSAHEGSLPERHFAVAVFVVSGERVLLLFHKKLRMWLPPGGHIERGELPDEAALREVREETGVDAVLVGEKALTLPYPRQLVRPEGIQVERIAEGHEHVDLVYFARPAGGALTPPVQAKADECELAGWYTAPEAAALGANEEMRIWVERAVRTVRERLAMP